MLRKITGWFDWFLQNKQVWICIIMLMIMTRYGYLLYYNWNFGNTGKPGIQLYEDSDRYTEGAERIMHLSPLNDQQINYTGY
ncbi:MAG: hypothetical protein HY738_11010, partial [Bacteroidia bacterium]|nr:hypothetical protein [Bacteroidia bacterium]